MLENLTHSTRKDLSNSSWNTIFMHVASSPEDTGKPQGYRDWHYDRIPSLNCANLEIWYQNQLHISGLHPLGCHHYAQALWPYQFRSITGSTISNVTHAQLPCSIATATYLEKWDRFNGWTDTVYLLTCWTLCMLASFHLWLTRDVSTIVFGWCGNRFTVYGTCFSLSTSTLIILDTIDACVKFCPVTTNSEYTANTIMGEASSSDTSSSCVEICQSSAWASASTKVFGMQTKSMDSILALV